MPHLDRPQQLLLKTQALIGDALEAVEATYAAELASRNSCIRDIFQHTNRFRGKRLRPILCLLAAKACGDITREHEILAAVIEMIHTATLVHDDVLDNADVRRYVATVNVRWNNQTSVLYGDFLFTHAFHLAAQTGSAEACRLIGHATNRVCEGELTQIHHRGNLGLTEEEYLDIIDGKTAELCAVACYLGARFAKAEESHVGRLERYGRKLGLAFQIADDVLDLIGMQNSVGKTLGTDLMQRKLTLPTIRMLQRAEDTQRSKLIELLEEGSESSCQQIAELAQQTGMIDDSLRFAHQLAEEARDELSGIPDTPARQLLMLLPELSINRTC